MTEHKLSQKKEVPKEVEKLQAAKDALIKKESELKFQLKDVDFEKIDELSKTHKQLLHQLNETKDLGYYLMGVLAKYQQTSIREIALKYDVEES